MQAKLAGYACQPSASEAGQSLQAFQRTKDRFHHRLTLSEDLLRLRVLQKTKAKYRLWALLLHNLPEFTYLRKTPTGS